MTEVQSYYFHLLHVDSCKQRQTNQTLKQLKRRYNTPLDERFDHGTKVDTQFLLFRYTTHFMSNLVLRQ